MSVSPRRARTKSAIGDDGAEPPQNPISLSFGSSAVPALLHPPASFFPHSWRRPICTWACGRRMWLGWSGHDTGICKGVFIIVAWQSRSSSHRSVSWTELEKLLSSLSLSCASSLPAPFLSFGITRDLPELQHVVCIDLVEVDSFPCLCWKLNNDLVTFKVLFELFRGK